jgi:hypothetical protein
MAGVEDAGERSCKEQKNGGCGEAAGEQQGARLVEREIVKSAHGICTVVWPGSVIWITPAHMHISFEVESSAGMLPMSTVGAPGAHGATVAGTQGIGVSTPRAAAVAVITTGLLGEEHMPKGGMFTIGLLSMMVAAGVPVSVLFSGSTMSEAGAAPKLHARDAPIHTCIAIFRSLLFSEFRYTRSLMIYVIDKAALECRSFPGLLS